MGVFVFSFVIVFMCLFIGLFVCVVLLFAFVCCLFIVVVFVCLFLCCVLFKLVCCCCWVVVVVVVFVVARMQAPAHSPYVHTFVQHVPTVACWLKRVVCSKTHARSSLYSHGSGAVGLLTTPKPAAS